MPSASEEEANNTNKQEAKSETTKKDSTTPATAASLPLNSNTQPKNDPEGDQSTDDEIVDYEASDDDDENNKEEHPTPQKESKEEESVEKDLNTPPTKNPPLTHTDENKYQTILKGIDIVECRASRRTSIPGTTSSEKEKDNKPIKKNDSTEEEESEESIKSGKGGSTTAWTNESMAVSMGSPSSVSTAPSLPIPHKQKKTFKETDEMEGKNKEEEDSRVENKASEKRSKQETSTLPNPPAPPKDTNRGYNQPLPPPKRPLSQEYGGVYIPPSKRRALELERQQQLSSSQQQPLEEGEATSTSPQYDIHHQRQNWLTLKKAINGTVNRLNSTTLKPLLHSLFSSANLIRGRGLLAKTLLRAAMTSPSYSDVYAAFIAVINSKLPEIGELVLSRTILAFQRSFKRREKRACVALCTFLGHLFNQGLTHELLVLQLLTILLDGGSRNTPTDDSVELAVEFLKVVGMALLEHSKSGVHAVMERFRDLLHDGSVSLRVQYQIEQLMSIRRREFRDYPSLKEELDLVEREDQIMFEIGLEEEEELKKEEILDVFRFDEEFEKNEEVWRKIRGEILGEEESDGSDDDESSTDGSSESGTPSDSDDSNDDDNEEEDNDGELALATTTKKSDQTIVQDLSESDLINLRRTIYLTIMSSATFEECTHKLARTSIPPGRESELINMLIECCSQERTFLRYYGLISSRFCLMDQRWRTAFAESFKEQYGTIHRLETNKLRNVAKLFAHLLHTDSLGWDCLECVRLNEEETTSSSRIFVKILVQEMAEAMGMAALRDRFEVDGAAVDEKLAGEQKWYSGMFPKDSARNTRYAINFFTSIGLGPLTDGLRLHLKNAPKLILAQAQREAERAAEEEQKRREEEGSSDSDSSSSSSSSSDTSTGSSSSSSVSSSSSYSSNERRRRGRSRRRGRGDGGRRRRRRRRYSSSSSSTSSSTYSSSSTSTGSSYSSYSDKHRRRGRHGGRSRSRSRSTSRGSRSISNSRSPSPFKDDEEGKKTSKEEKDQHDDLKKSKSGSISRSDSPSYSSSREGRKRRNTRSHKDDDNDNTTRRKSKSVSSSSSTRSSSYNKSKKKKKRRSITPPSSVVVTKSSPPSPPPPREEDKEEEKSKKKELKDEKMSRLPSPPARNKQHKERLARKRRDDSSSSPSSRSRSISPPSRHGRKHGGTRSTRSPSSSSSRSRSTSSRRRKRSISPPHKKRNDHDEVENADRKEEDEKRAGDGGDRTRRRRRRRRSPSYSSGSSRSRSPPSH